MHSKSSTRSLEGRRSGTGERTVAGGIVVIVAAAVFIIVQRNNQIGGVQKLIVGAASSVVSVGTERRRRRQGWEIWPVAAAAPIGRRISNSAANRRRDPLGSPR